MLQFAAKNRLNLMALLNAAGRHADGRHADGDAVVSLTEFSDDSEAVIRVADYPAWGWFWWVYFRFFDDGEPAGKRGAVVL